MYVFNALVSTAVFMVSEFQFLDNLRSKYALDKIGGDCAVLPKDADTDLLLTADMLIEDIDFRLEWTTPEFLGHKALAVSLSDIAAMGGEPKWAMLSLGVPENLWESNFVDRFYVGWFEVANEFGVELVGGDISRAPDKLVIDSIAGGEVPKGKAIMRSGAKSGDLIYVTGTLGGAAGGLKLLEQGHTIQDNNDISTGKLLRRQLKTTPQLRAANLLQQLNIVTSMIDLSDGLSSDLAHICQASVVGARIYADRLPIDDDLRKYFPAEDCLELALNGGEDFELLFTVSPPNSMDITGTYIGEIIANEMEIVKNGETQPLPSKGYEHFS